MDRGPSWLKRAAVGPLLLLGIAIGARVVWELLAPLLPVLISLAFICSLFWWLVRRR